MSIKLKALLVALGTVALAVASHDFVVSVAPRPPSPQELGLAWLKQEYHVPDAAFERIKALHEEYFQRCDAMCAEMLDVRRPFALKFGKHQTHRQSHESRLRARAEARARQKALCESCLGTMVAHLEAVAALMPAGEGERFLKDLLPELVNPRELQELRASSRPVQ